MTAPTDLVSVAEAQLILGVSRNWFWVLRQRGLISLTEYRKPTSTRLFFSRAEVERVRDEVRPQ